MTNVQKYNDDLFLIAKLKNNTDKQMIQKPLKKL